MQPEKIGRYQIKKEIGRGGMSIVYLAYDPYLERDVAVKVLPAQFTHDTTFFDLFDKEKKIIAGLQHDSIVPVHDSGIHQGRPYFVMDWMKGGSLADRFKQDEQMKPLGLNEIEKILIRICSALDKAHEGNIIHRDIKPGNILFDEDGSAYLADFGIAKVSDATQSTALVGTPKYMAPEQANNKPLDRRTDVYQMGIVFFEMLTGKVPYDADDKTAILYKHVHEPIPSVLKANPNLPAACEAVIDKAIAKKQKDRFATASEFARAFSEALRAPDDSTTVVINRPTTETKPSDDPVLSNIQIDFVRIPAGELIMGSDPNKDRHARLDERPQHRVFLEEFWISKFPVTNVQYAVFLSETSYRAPQNWKKVKVPSGKANHPVCYIAWNDALAFCRWLGRKLNQKYRLPTEAEWEKAARGTDGRVFPWGNTWDASRLNAGRGRPKEKPFRGLNLKTTSVSQYSRLGGESPYGVADMCGNIAEWCSTIYKPYPYGAEDGREDLAAPGARVFRGGSLDLTPDLIGCARRYQRGAEIGYWDPDSAGWFHGFRIAFSE
jgi:serine/threonine-protein kinase